MKRDTFYITLSFHANILPVVPAGGGVQCFGFI